MKHPDTNLMDTWLVDNHAKVRVNLGESNVADLRFADLFPTVGQPPWMSELTLGNNSTWGSSRLRQAVAATYPALTASNVLVTAGVSEAVVTVCLAHHEVGGNLVIPVPAFHALVDVPEKLGYEIRRVALEPQTSFRLCASRIIAAMDERTRLVLLNSPHNPTGRVYGYDEIMQVAAAAEAVGATVVVDEHYRYLPRDPSEEWIRSVACTHKHVVALGSVGKCFGCTGIRVGWMLAPEALLGRYHHYKLLVTHTIPVISDYLAAEILERRHALLPRTRADIATNLRSLELLAARNQGVMRLHEPDAGSVAFVQLRDVKDTFGFADRLLEEFGVLVLPGESFNMPGFLRMRLGVAPAEFILGCEALERALTGRM